MTLSDLIAQIMSDASQLDRLVRDREWGQAHERSRMLLAGASRLHTRVTAVITAQEELSEEQ